MHTTQSRADSFVRAFAEGLLERSGLTLVSPARERTVADLERAIHERLGVAAFERLGEQRIQEVVKEFLHGAPQQELIVLLQKESGASSRFVEEELQTFAVEFLAAARIQ